VTRVDLILGVDCNKGQCTIETSNVYSDEEYVCRKNAEIPQGRYAVIAVSATGHGISADHSHIFSIPFIRRNPLAKGPALAVILDLEHPERGDPFKPEAMQTSEIR
jgi:hypothetical protein